ncbi:molybdopterin-dependent oxidoreductase [Streptomyces sp. NPDC056437]|uniref:molybdopterin-containing oxidoreductase family protein n=1 Tax=Streptomyces sp. NPDC056437 TaxID=3345816 RepID=UPI0036774020
MSGETTTVKSVCRMCHGGCGALVELTDGVPTGISGDPENPTSRGYFCIKGKASLDLVSSPDRLRTPLARTGPRGSGSFKPISWDEALDEVARNLRRSMVQFGSESVVFGQGTDRNYQEWVFRLANAIGTPNVVGPAHVCFYPRVMASILTYGGFTFCDYHGDPEVVLLWGSNKVNTHSDGVIGVDLLGALERGSRLVVIDPRRTRTAERATLHLQLKPGTDAALALGLIHLLIAHDWYDEQFVARHTSGFDELERHVRAYDLSTVAGITGLEPSLIETAARMYARASRACIEAGTGVSQSDNAFDTHRAIAILSALSGNLDAPGGDVIWDPMPIEGRRGFPRTDLLSEEQAAKRIGGTAHKVLSMSGWVAPGDLQEAILRDSPYRISSMVVFGSNPLVSHENATATEAALTKLDFLAVADMFMTPTARLADIVLPASSWLERDQIVEFNSYIAARQRVVTVEGARSDEEMILDLARRLDLGHHFYPSLEDALDAKLSGIDLTWQQFKKVGHLPNTRRYRKYATAGFRTRSGRVDLAHRGLEAMGYDAVPVFRPPASTTDELPFVMTSAHNLPFFNTEFRQLPTTSRRYREPHVTIHPRSAAGLAVADGDQVEIYRDPEGAGVVMTVRVSDTVAPDVIVADAGWWYPGEEDLHAATRSSINRITDSGRRDPYMGSSTLRGVPVGLRPIVTAEAEAEPEETADAEAEGGGGAHGAHSTH